MTLLGESMLKKAEGTYTSSEFILESGHGLEKIECAELQLIKQGEPSSQTS
jgi:hypothetical protein